MTHSLLLPDAAPQRVPVLDEHQQRVVDHPGGPLLVLAGPGTGKTTTLVEAIVRRIEEGASPESILALTFSRKAAEQLRERVALRLGRTLSGNLSSTFHSFAYQLVRANSTTDLYTNPLRLLSAPEQDALIADLLTTESEAIRWPEEFSAAVGTRGFAREVASVLARATEKGLGSLRLRELGLLEGRPDLVAAAAFMEQYETILGDENAIDYPGLIATAVGQLQDPEQGLRERLRARYRHVFVDEYQDTDPSQVALLRALAGDGRNLTAVGDPHQSIYAFRGAQVRGILDFPTEFPKRDGSPADVVVLRTTRRFGPRILMAAQRVAGRIPLGGSIDADRQREFLAPQPVETATQGRVDVLTFDTERAETEHLADILRRAHLEDDIPWSEMAVLVRSGRGSIPGLRRSLGAAGVPVEVASDDTPLVREPSVLPLLDVLQAVADPVWLDAERAHALLLSPLVGLDATEVRSLARALRARDRDEPGPAVPSGELLLGAVRDPSRLAGLRLPHAARAAALGELIAEARACLADGGSCEEVLWTIWDGTSWPGRLRRATERGGAGARLAHRDLDAICALFDAAGRAQEQSGHKGLQEFLAMLRGQELPADTLAETGIRGEAVRLLTAHRAKGLEWRLVVIAHVQEETWPDLRRRSTLLGADTIQREGLVAGATARELLAEERRLFYVAATRAKERLIATAVASPDDEGEQPSRFLTELGRDVVHHRGRPTRPLSMNGLVAALRRTVADPAASEALRDAAARRLRRLGEETVPAALPGTWWGTRAMTLSEQPVRPLDQPLRVSASTLTGIEQCATQWFLQREAGGEQSSSQQQGFGNVVHALADRLARGDIVEGPVHEVVAALMEHIDQVWEEVPFRTPWSAKRERDEAEKALTRYLHHVAAERGRTVLATEHELDTEVTLPDGSRVRLKGRADRLEADEQGRVVVIDLKTTKYPSPDKDLGTNPQLGFYQLAVEMGAVADLEGASNVPGGAELWQLRHGTRELKVQHQKPLPPGDPTTPIVEQLMTAGQVIRGEVFPARVDKAVCDRCQFRNMCPAWNSKGVLS